jgi:hypothetical protein
LPNICLNFSVEYASLSGQFRMPQQVPMLGQTTEFLSHNSEGWKAEVTVEAWSGFGENCLLIQKRPTCHMPPRGRKEATWVSDFLQRH